MGKNDLKGVTDKVFRVVYLYFMVGFLFVFRLNKFGQIRKMVSYFRQKTRELRRVGIACENFTISNPIPKVRAHCEVLLTIRIAIPIA